MTDEIHNSIASPGRLAQLRANWDARVGRVHSHETLAKHLGPMLNQLENMVTMFCVAIGADIRNCTIQHMIDQFADLAKTSSIYESRRRGHHNVG